MPVRRARLADAEPLWQLLTQLAVTFTPQRSEFDALYPALVDDDRMLLQELVVDALHRGTGLGTQLLGAVEAECRARGVRQLVVASRRAAGFYAARGYAVTADYLKRVL